MVGAGVSTAEARSVGEESLISGSARVVRGRVRRARGEATHRALLAAVWRQTLPLLAGPEGHKRLRQQLSGNVRRLIARFRTRKVTRAGGQLTVLLAVRVDSGALRQRLRSLGARLKLPGVLVLADCAEETVAASVRRALAGVGIRPVTGPWPAAEQLQVARAALARPGSALTRMRATSAVAVVLVSCRSKTQGKVAEAGVTGVSALVKALAYVSDPPRAPRRLLSLKETAHGHHADVKQATRLALTRACGRLAAGLARELPHRLPSGAARTLLVRLRGGLGLGTQLQLARRMVSEVGGVTSVSPTRFVPGETWLAVRTTNDPTSLRQALTALTPPSGWRLTVAIGPLPGSLELKAELKEDS